MSTLSLEDRGRALEDEFFNKENAEKIEALKAQLHAQEDRAALSKASGMTDTTVLDQLLALGLTAPTITALSLVPLVFVAWADGEMQDKEREAILQGAHAKGLTADSPGHKLLETWLAKRPADALLAAWESYIHALSTQLNADQKRLLRTQIVSFAKIVADAAGGILGFGKTSSAEEAMLERLGNAFA